MKKIQMVDLVSQYKHIEDEINEAVLNVIRSSAYINGPEVKEFQKELEAQNTNVITKVRLLEPRLDQKGEKVKFTIIFHYRNFSK